MVCAHCGSESHRTGETVCAKYCTLCKEPGHRQKRAGCKFRVCNKCGASGHSASECTPCSECGSTTHKSALSFACPEHQCTNCEGTLEPKGHNRFVEPKRLPSNANYDVRRMRRNRPQREQMPDSSVQCMWSSKSQITNEPFVSRTRVHFM